MPLSRRLFCLALGAAAATPAAAAADEPAPEALVMYRRVGCPWCHAWDEEVGPVYPLTEIGAALPLREVDLDREGDGGVALARPVRYTPTFVLVADGRELARIEGYPGDEFFWVRLEQLAAAAAPEAGTDQPGEDTP